MKRILHKIFATAIMLLALCITLTAQPIGSKIKTDTNGHISYWNGLDTWIPVTPGFAGQILQFTAGVPTWINNPNGITTTAVTNISGTTAVSGGNILSDGGAKITARGVCWSTSPNPTITGSKTIDGEGIGSFTSNITGLASGSTYFVRAYATTSEGSAYGNEVIVIQPDPIAWFPFNGNTNDITGNLNDGVNYGAVSATDRFGNVNSSYYFNGGSYIKIPQVNWDAIGNGDFSISVWVKPENFYDFRMILNDNITDNFQLNFANGGGTIQLYLGQNYSNYNSTNYNFVSSFWYYITVTRNNGIKKYYINGQEYGSFNQNTSIAKSVFLEIGGRANASQHPFIGSIDDIKIYRRALNANEIISNYKYGKVFDIDGNAYDTVQIGSQVWMKQNLNTSRYNNGIAIPNVTDNAAWSGLNTGARCYYNNDSAYFSVRTGSIYNWNVVNSNNICPIGWHVPSDNEWTVLETYLGGSNIAGSKLKSTDWGSYGTDESRFSALGGGGRNSNGNFDAFGLVGIWWTSDSFNISNAWYRYIFSNDVFLGKTNDNKLGGVSIRCLKD